MKITNEKLIEYFGTDEIESLENFRIDLAFFDENDLAELSELLSKTTAESDKVSVMIDSQSPEKTSKFLEVIKTANFRMDLVLETILDLSVQQLEEIRNNNISIENVFIQSRSNDGFMIEQDAREENEDDKIKNEKESDEDKTNDDEKANNVSQNDIDINVGKISNSKEKSTKYRKSPIIVDEITKLQEAMASSVGSVSNTYTLEQFTSVRKHIDKSMAEIDKITISADQVSNIDEILEMFPNLNNIKIKSDDTVLINPEEISRENIAKLYSLSQMVRLSTHTEYSPEEIKEIIDEQPELKDKILMFNGGMISVNLDNYEPENLTEENKFCLFLENISSEEEFQKFEKFARLEPNATYSLLISNVSEISNETLKRLKDLNINFNITMNSPGIEHHQREPYDLDTFIAIKGKLDELVKGIDLDLPEKEKFAEVYKRVCGSIIYDTEAAYPENEEQERYADENVANCRNLKNGLLEGKCVCAGYAEILRNALSLVGIEARYVRGEVIKGVYEKKDFKREEHKHLYVYSEDENTITLASGHAWNKVKLDGVWYNVDPTWDATSIRNGNLPNHCLQSDQDLASKKKVDFKGPECPISAEVDEIKRLFNSKKILVSIHDVINSIREGTKKNFDSFKKFGNTIKSGINFLKDIPLKSRNILLLGKGKKSEIEEKNSINNDDVSPKENSEVPPWDLSNFGVTQKEYWDRVSTDLKGKADKSNSKIKDNTIDTNTNSKKEIDDENIKD